MPEINSEEASSQLNLRRQQSNAGGSLHSISHLSSLTPSQNDSDSVGNADPSEKRRSSNGRFRRCRLLLDHLQRIEATDLELNPMEAGIWDEWGAYYCSSRFGRHTSFNPNYFALTAIMIVGQSNFFDLITLMHENGGVAFLLVLIMTYISFGYPAYIVETLMGQYSGRKPILMIRFMMPAFSGLGVALYIRTFFRAINALGIVSHCLYHCWDLLFCKGGQSVLLKRILIRRRDHKVFRVFLGLEYPYLNDIDPAFLQEKPWILTLTALGFFVCLKKLKEFAAGMKVVLRLLLLFLAGYSINGYMRSRSAGVVPTNSILDLPLQLTFRTDWLKLYDGWVWVKAIVFVVHSLELGTLVHPYLGSKGFFHYRCTRDGIYLVMVTLTWNVIGALGVLFWLGYIGIDEAEIRASFDKLHGHFGMFVVFIMKHLQAEMTQSVEGDVLLFCSIFYLITGIAALLAFACYLYVLIDCAYPESGHPLIKILLLLGLTSLFGGGIYPLLLTEEGIRHLIFLNFYVGNSWVGIFIIICYVSAVVWSQGMARVLHDYYNVMHLKGYALRTHFYQIPKIMPFLFIGFLVFAMISDAVNRRLHEGSTDWTDASSVCVGVAISLTPVFAVVFGAIRFMLIERKDKSVPVFQPHRDFYKNKHHISVCFKDYENFEAQDLSSTEKLEESKIV